MRLSSLACVAALLAVVLCGDFVRAQSNRRERQDPELIVESGGRLAYCDQMLFTPDGKWVLTVGDDKVVRLWACTDGKLDALSMRVLRWNIWREQRGAIYSVAVSADREGRYVAIGGVGEATTTVAVFDRVSGEMIHYGVPDAGRNLFGVMSVAFTPSGKRLAVGTADGTVFVWDFKRFRPIGRHDVRVTPLIKDGFNRVRLVRFLDEERLLSVAESSEVVEWKLNTEPVERARSWIINRGYSVRVATLSADHRWLAFGLKGPVIAVRSIDNAEKKDVDLDKGQFPRSVAFDSTVTTLAVGVGNVPPESRFYMETDDHVRLFDVAKGDFKAKKPLEHAGRAESLAFHPDGGLLAVAGGNDHEVSLHDLTKNGRIVSVMRGVGTCLWDVGLSADGQVLGFKDHRNAKSRVPNERGQGAWRTFHLPRRRWVSADEFKPVERLDTVDGWTVKPDNDDAHVWYAVNRVGTAYRLEYDGAREGMPRCYTFMERDADHPPRLAVGHYWGLSVYELRPTGPKRVRLCVGHQGEVTALGLSADRSWLVTASNDQTIAAWALSIKWPSEPILGAAFETRGAKLLVKAVDTGSPAWEAGLIVGDEIVLFAFDGKQVVGGPGAWQLILRDPVPGKEHYFRVIRDGKQVDMLTTCRQRPIWRYFPTSDGEWVLWMWRNSFYDTSTKGDFAIGWHVNSPEPGQTPKYYRAEQFRKIYQKRTVIDKLLQTREVQTALKLLGDNPLPARFDETEPPAVALTLSAVPGGWEATLTATPRGDNPDHQPRAGELWVNDFRLERWASVGDWEKEGRKYSLKVRVPETALRAGENVLTFQTSNRIGGRAEVSTTVQATRKVPERPRVLGLLVGINDYKASTPPRGQDNLVNLTSAVSDAQSIKKKWEEQKHFGATELTLLTDAAADCDEIVKAFDALARKATPDDLCVIFLAGHGMFREEEGKDTKRSLFIFCCPRFQGDNPEKTGLTSEVLYEKLAAINCRKLVLLDACHSGEAASNPVRGLTPGGQGPVILAACDRNQHSYENPKFGHGLFTYCLLEALGERFAKADADGNKKLDTRELYDYARARLPELLGEIKQNEFLQVPIMFAPQPRPFTVTGRE